MNESPHRHDDPIAAFLAAWSRVKQTAPPGVDPAVVTLATAAADGRPSARVVLLRGASSRGFQFYTNYGSRKARELDANARASLCFFWYWLGEQVRVDGDVVRASDEESDAYFATRPRGSQISAWASRQSEPLASRAELEALYRDVERKYAGVTIPRPPFWGGYAVVPAAIEFWRAGEHRLHDRLRYTRRGDGWEVDRLNP